MYPGIQISARARVELYDFKRYLEQMEKTIRYRNAEIQYAIEEEQHRVLLHEYSLVRESWEPEYHHYAVMFPRFLREGFFLSCWSWFESYIYRTCSYMEKYSKIPLGWAESRSSVLNKTKKYFKKVRLTVAIRDKSWNEINHYAQIRHTILHHGGFYRIDSSKGRAFTNYLAQKKIIAEKLSPGEIAIIKHG